MPVDPYLKKLLELSKQLTSTEVEDLIFLNSDKFGVGQTEKVKKPLDLFKLLRENGDIDGNNNSLLIELFLTIKRKDLVDKYFYPDTGNLIFEEQVPEARVSAGYANNVNLAYEPVPSYNDQHNYYYGTNEAAVPGVPGVQPTACQDPNAAYAYSAEERNHSQEFEEENGASDASSLASSTATSSTAATSIPVSHRLQDLKVQDFDLQSDGAAAGIEPVEADGCAEPSAALVYDGLFGRDIDDDPSRPWWLKNNNGGGPTLVNPKCDNGDAVDLKSDTQLKEADVVLIDTDKVDCPAEVGDPEGVGAQEGVGGIHCDGGASDVFRRLPLDPTTGKVNHARILPHLKLGKE